MTLDSDNPYLPPNVMQKPMADHRSVVGTVFFAINIIVAAFLIFISVVAVVLPESPYSFLGGIMLLPPAACAAIMEWVAWYRRGHVLERVLGGLCLGVAALVAFGVISGVAEALQDTWPEGFEWFVGIGLAITSYFVACGAWRVSHSVQRGLGQRPRKSKP
ncbi:MAG: hypothetical protein GXY58_18440 [Planctomycetaceae bacterium]|nr:hypothetical protein [Planctomycetaceae bacterium]